MSTNEPTLRGGPRRRSGPYPLGQIPDAVLSSLGRQFVYRLAVGHGDLKGDDFRTIFANAIEGTHHKRSLGIADIVANDCAWSFKTVKTKRPFSQKVVRLISGRNSPDDSVGIEDSHVDPERTGRAVLAGWNARVNEALDEFKELRIVILVHNIETREFVLFEEEAARFNPVDYRWSFNTRGNLEGRNWISGYHHFTCRPHGSQFTIRSLVPGSARRFSIARDVPAVDQDTILASVDFSDAWIRIEPAR